MSDEPTLSPAPFTSRPPRSTGAAVAVVTSASLAMAATLPARTHGLGLITTRVLEDFSSLDATGFAQINLVATLLGSLCCLPCGWLLDRYGVRRVLPAVMLGLAATVWAMSHTAAPWLLALAVTLSRGIGQSMLSVVSISMLGKWFRRNAGWAMGSYAVLMTLLMAVATAVLAWRVSQAGWRPAWREVAVMVGLLAPLAWLLAAPPRRLASQHPADAPHVPTTAATGSSATLADAMRTTCFWMFAISISLFGLVSSGVTLFQQLILQERGLSESVFHVVLVIGLLSGMVANLLGGWASRKISMAPLLTSALLLLAGSLAALPLLQTAWHAYAQAVVAGIGGGLMTVLFFAVWVHAFGPDHLGRIQGVAQMMTVLASAAGPLVVAAGRDALGSYFPVLYMLSAVAAVLAGVSLLVRVPSAARGDWAGVTGAPSREPVVKPRVSSETSA